MKIKSVLFLSLLFSVVSVAPSHAGWFKKKSKAAVAEPDSVKTSSKYDDIKSKATLTQSGLFTIIQKENDYYYEIPDSLMGRDFLVINKLRQVPEPLNEAGVNKGINYENILIRFQVDKSLKKVFIRNIKPKPHTPHGDAIAQSVDDNFISSLIEGLSIEAFNADSTAYLVKINDLYNGTETSLNNIFSNINLGTSALSKLSRIVRTKAFENNVVVTSELTTKVTEATSSIYITVVTSSSIILLSEKPMPGRFESNRVGYFTTPQMYFSDSQQAFEAKDLITRWRLEPREEDVERYLAGEPVEPKKPIVFYIDSSTPYQWREYMKRGVEDWQTAFERAGFKNAIQGVIVEGDTVPDMDDVNYSGITYVASAKVNAMGPSIYDPRSGEIIGADIIWWHNVMTMLQKWNTMQTGAVNPAARALILPDSLMGDAIRFVACHEVGHSLGLRHNMMGSAAFPTDSLRSKTFTDRMNSTASSIMDYARYNYVAQPGDGVTKLSPHIGPYDLFAIEYGYRWYGKATPQEEADLLYDFLQRHTGRLYRYSEAQSSRDAVDPRAQSEDLGDDPVKSSRYGIDNLKRVVPEMINWTLTGEKGQSYEEAGKLYMAVINQWNDLVYHTLANVGGIYMENTTVGDGVKTYTFVEKARQEESVQFIIDEVFTFPEWLFANEVGEYVYPMRKTPMGYVPNSPSLLLKNALSYMFWDLLDNKRLIRMLENESYNGRQAYRAVDLVDKLHRHVFRSTEAGRRPNDFERLLQKNLVDALILSVSTDATNKNRKALTDGHFLFDCEESFACSHYAHDVHTSLAKAPNFYASQADRMSDAISIKRGELLRIKELLERRANTQDMTTRYHYKDLVLRIDAALDLK